MARSAYRSLRADGVLKWRQNRWQLADNGLAALDYVGKWDGYTEAYTFQPDGSNRVRLTIDAQGQGTLEVGNAALLPPPTDPNVGYPPSADGGAPSEQIPQSNSGLTEGFLYPIYGTQVVANRIQLGTVPGDLYSAWCALQTPYPIYQTTVVGIERDGGIVVPTADGGVPVTVQGVVDGGRVSTSYSCVPGDTAMWSPSGCTVISWDGTTTSVDCGKLSLFPAGGTLQLRRQRVHLVSDRGRNAGRRIPRRARRHPQSYGDGAGRDAKSLRSGRRADHHPPHQVVVARGRNAARYWSPPATGSRGSAARRRVPLRVLSQYGPVDLMMF